MAYTGITAKIPLGEFGLLTDIAQDKIPPGALIRANNVCFENGAVQKAPGGLRWNASALPAGLVAVHQWRPDVNTRRMIAVTSTGSIYRGQDREFGTAINTGIASVLTPNCAFAEGGAETAGRDKKLFLFTEGATNPYVLTPSGNTFELIESPAADWDNPQTYPKFGLVHRNRMWAFAGFTAYASDTGDHENFATNGLVEPIYPGEGGELRGAYVYKGRLFAFKDGGFTYMLNDSSTTEAEWYWDKIANNFDLAAPNAVTEALDDMIAGNSTGTLTSYAASQKLGSIEAADIIQGMQFESFLRGSTSKVGVPFQHVLYYAEKKLLLATYRSAYYTYNDMLIVTDFARNDRLRPAFWIKGSPQCLALYKDENGIERPMYGDKDGYLVLMDREDRTEGGTAYVGEFQIPHLDFSHLGQEFSAANKHFDHLSVQYSPESTGNLSCDYYIDGKYIDTISFPMVQFTEPQLDVLLLSTDRLAQGNTESALKRIRGTGRTFSARFYQSGSNQSFQISAVTVFFRPGGHGAQKAT